ncbi:unnamed protein product [Dovyalis caffra]|uniref:Uncharacterized protein n=1 Tax=Dovyalis caffra TaxID=77055 RepID=A0AAV1R433_9ROSI|nr:unnamed protein product [Dovyalis caffra]
MLPFASQQNQATKPEIKSEAFVQGFQAWRPEANHTVVSGAYPPVPQQYQGKKLGVHNGFSVLQSFKARSWRTKQLRNLSSRSRNKSKGFPCKWFAGVDTWLAATAEVAAVPGFMKADAPVEKEKEDEDWVSSTDD